MTLRRSVYALLVCLVDKVELSSSLWPNEGVLNINTMFNNFTICQDGSLKNVKNDVCTKFGFPKADTVDLLLPPESLDIQPNSAGSLSCDGMSTNLSRCSISPNDSCSSYAYLKCKFVVGQLIHRKI